MSVVFQELVDRSQTRFRHLRQLTQFYHRFAGDVIRIQQDRSCALTHMEVTGEAIELHFEEEDRDGFEVGILPFCNELIFVHKVGFWAQMNFQLFRFCSNPEALQAVNEMHMKTQLGCLFGAGTSVLARSRNGKHSLEQPGCIHLETQGSRIYVSTKLIWNLSAYQGEGSSFDRKAISRDLDAVSHGLEKCLGAVS
jgi:hypothetical protein